MDIVGDRKYVEIPGDRTHQLPPLLIHQQGRRLAKMMEMAEQIVESEELLAELTAEPMPQWDRERRRMDLAINLVERYFGVVHHWQWGDAILEWIRQCEITFEQRPGLRNLLRADIWPHAGRSSFVTLLMDKAVRTEGVALDKAVGLRLTFRQPPPLACFSDQFLFYLNSPVASTAYQRWVQLTPEPVSSLPPERFHFDVVNM